MHSFSWITSRRAQKGALVSFFCFVFLPLLTHPGAVAQQVVLPTAKAFDGGAMNQPKNDVTLTGTVQQLMEKATAGVPGGVQAVAEGPQGTFTAILGPKLSDAMRQGLVAGAQITASGISETIDANSYLIVRKLTVSGSPFTIRNEHGFTVHAQERSRAVAVNAISGSAK
jgi:hypothetical protein